MIQRIQNSKWVFVLISVFLAVIFWMYVRNDLDPPGSRRRSPRSLRSLPLSPLWWHGCTPRPLRSSPC